MIRKVGNGPRPWRVRAIDGSGRKVQESFRTKELAEKFDRELADERARVRAGMDAPKPDVSFNDLADLFLASRPRRKSDEWFRSMLEHSRDAFGDVLVRRLLPEVIGRWLHGLDKAPKTKTHILTAMRQVLNAGVEWGYLDRSPVRPGAITAPGQKRLDPIEPFESWEDVLKVAAAVTPFYAPLVRFACATGLRPSELLELRWKDVNLRERVAHIRGTKTRAAERTIYLSRPALGALRDQPRAVDPNERVFPGRHGGRLDWAGFRRNHWYAALDAAGYPRRSPGQMRHTFATLALAQGVPLDTISELMGHETVEITRRHYAKWIRPVMERARDLLDALETEGREETGT